MTSSTALRLFVVVSFALVAPALRAQDGLPPSSDGAPADAAPPADPPAPAAQPAASAPADAAPTLPAPAAGPGSLEIVTDQPGADAFVDGARVGKTPLRVDGLAEGAHRIQVSREGGAPAVRDVTVLPGQVSRVDIILAGGPVRPQSGTLGAQDPQANPQQAPQAAGGSKFGLPGREFFATFLEQPWAWAAAGICAVSLLTAAVLWTLSSPQAIPVVGPSIPVLGGDATTASRIWLGVRLTALGVAAFFGVVALLLFVWPSLPFAKFIQLPDLSKMMGLKKDDKAQPAGQPAGQPAAPQPAPAPAPQPAPAK